MAFLTIAEARKLAQAEYASLRKSASTVLKEEASTNRTSFDIFLSHSRLDAEAVRGAKIALERRGKTVYVDWVEDPDLDRGRVSPATATKLRVRMGQCKALFYAHSSNSTKSRWMPWELGYFDAEKGNVAVFPLIQTTSEGFKGEEYLGLYPYVDLTAASLWIHQSATKFVGFNAWLTQSDKLRPAT